MKLNRLQAITRATWIESTARHQQGTYEVLVSFDQGYKQESHRSTNLSQCFSNDFLKICTSAFAASPRANTTISILTICWRCKRKLSRTVLFMRFRATAFLMAFLAMASPSLGCDKGLLIARTVKYLSEDFTGFAKTFLYSAGVLSRYKSGKPKSSANN